MAAGKVVLYSTSNGNNAIQKVVSLISARVQFAVTPPGSTPADNEWVITAIIGAEKDVEEDERL